MEKAFVNLFGDSEYALRLFPLLAGISALVLFTLVARRLLTGWAVPFAVLIFATMQPLVYYSAEVKQYGVDVAAALLVLYATLRFLDGPVDQRRALIWGGVGGIALLLSHPASLVMGACAAVATVVILLRRPRAGAGPLALGLLVFLGAFALEYAISLRRLSQNTLLSDYWHGGYPPVPTRVGTTLSWLVHLPGRLVPDPLAVDLPRLLYALAVLGIVALLLRRRVFALLLLAVVALAVAAAVVRAYPVQWRLALYLVPLILLAAAAAVDAFAPLRRPLNLLAVLPALALLAVAAGPVADAGSAAAHPYTRTELRAVLDHVRSHRQPGDRVYVHWTAALLYDFYAPSLHLGRDGFLRFVARPSCDDRAELADLDGRRVWFVFAFPPGYDSADDAAATLAHVSGAGTRLDRFVAPGHAEADLYAVHIGAPAPDAPHPGLCLTLEAA